MRKTKHIEARMGQRGFNQKILNLVHMHGKCIGDKIILSKKEAATILEKTKKTKDLFLKVMNKGELSFVMQIEDTPNEFTLRRQEAKQLLQHLDRICQDLLRVIKKGGVTLIEEGDIAITVYNNYK